VIPVSKFSPVKSFMPIGAAYFLAGGFMPYVLERLLAQPQETREAN